MSRLLQGGFDVVAPALGAALVSADRRPALRAGLGTLAPVFKVGLECELDGESSPPDVQQAFVADDGDHRALLAYVSRLVAEGGPALDPGWRRILDVCQRWVDGPYADWLTHLWLEYDVDGALREAQLPSAFVQVPRGGRGSETRARIEEITERLWGRPLPPPLRAHLRTCFEAAPEGAWVSHVGMMLARPVDALRVNVKGLRAADADAFLSTLGGSGVEVAPALRWLLRYADHVTVCLDLGERLYPRVGLEGFLYDPPAVDLRWRALLDALVARGACTAPRRDALLEWVGEDYPPTAGAPWPAEMIARSLLAPDQLDGMARTLSHIKTVHQPDRPVSAKAYFGFGPIWGRPKPTAAGAGGHGTTLRPSRDSTAAIERAVAFLASAQNQAGGWRDYYGAYGSGDEYITAYVGAALTAIDSALAKRLAHEAWAFLTSRSRDNGGWGWNAVLPPDSDVIAWAVRLGRHLGHETDPCLQRAEELIGEHRAASGGLTSYTAEALPISAMAGWREPATSCITGVAAWLEPFGRSLLPYLRDAQRPDGAWGSYWFEESAYPTGLAAEALARWGEDGDRLKRAATWAVARLGTDGAVLTHGTPSPWSTAWAVRVLSAADAYPNEAARARQWLIDHQRPDGSWEASAPLRIPASTILNPDMAPEDHPTYLDDRRTYTTATVLVALAGGPAA